PARGGRVPPASALSKSTPVQCGGQTVGWVLLGAPPAANGASRPPPDVAFLDRVSWASAVRGGVCALRATRLGVLLARTLTQPLRELTAATQAMARGQIDQRV